MQTSPSRVGPSARPIPPGWDAAKRWGAPVAPPRRDAGGGCWGGGVGWSAGGGGGGGWGGGGGGEGAGGDRPGGLRERRGGEAGGGGGAGVGRYLREHRGRPGVGPPRYASHNSDGEAG